MQPFFVLANWGDASDRDHGQLVPKRRTPSTRRVATRTANTGVVLLDGLESASNKSPSTQTGQKGVESIIPGIMTRHQHCFLDELGIEPRTFRILWYAKRTLYQLSHTPLMRW